MSKQRKVLRPAKRGKIPLSKIKKAVKEVSEQRKECDEVKVKATEEIVPEAELKRRELAEKRVEQEKKDAIERAKRKELAAELGELTITEAKQSAILRQIAARMQKIANEIEGL